MMQAHDEVLGIVRWQRRAEQQPEQEQNVCASRMPIGLLLVVNGDVGETAAGQLLTAMLNAINLKRDDICIVAASAVEALMNNVKPAVLLAMGEDAAQTLLQQNLSLEALRNQPYHYGNDNIPMLVTYHPDHLLSYPADKRGAWSDLQKVKQLLHLSPMSS